MNIYESSEDYLEMMLMLRKSKGYVKSVDIAKELGVTKPSVSYAVKNLRENGYIVMEKNGDIFLTDKGEDIALHVYEKHCVLCGFLQSLGVGRENARKDACKIEHDISDETMEGIRRYMADNNIPVDDM